MRSGEVLITRRLAAEHEPEPSMGAILIDRARPGQIEGNDLVHRILLNLKDGQDPAAFAREARAYGRLCAGYGPRLP